MIAAALLRLARTTWVSRRIGWLFARHSRWLPLRRLRETDSAVAFWHPRPSYGVHVLIVPKRALASLADLPTGTPNPAAELLAVAVAVARDLGLAHGRYRLILNGGAYQDVKQVHLHLTADQAPPDKAAR